jgi:hypothetical protein
MDTLDLLEREAERKRKRRYDSPEDDSRIRGRDSPECKRKKRGEESPDGTSKRKRTDDDSGGNQMRLVGTEIAYLTFRSNERLDFFISSYLQSE